MAPFVCSPSTNTSCQAELSLSERLQLEDKKLFHPMKANNRALRPNKRRAKRASPLKNYYIKDNTRYPYKTPEECDQIFRKVNKLEKDAIYFNAKCQALLQKIEYMDPHKWKTLDDSDVSLFLFDTFDGLNLEQHLFQNQTPDKITPIEIDDRDKENRRPMRSNYLNDDDDNDNDNDDLFNFLHETLFNTI